MTHFIRGSNRASIVLSLLLLACRQAETPSEHRPQDRGIEGPDTSVAQRSLERETSFDNPFTRTSFEESYHPCLRAEIQVKMIDEGSDALVKNGCDYPVAILTSPLEVRVRLTGVEKFVNEAGATYAILYVVPDSLGKEAFRGDGIVRDGGLGVRRPPGYTTVAGGESITLPLRCDLDLPSGRYLLLLSTYEAPLEDSPPRSDPFDCSHSVESWNEGRKSAYVSFNKGVGPVPSASRLPNLEVDQRPVP